MPPENLFTRIELSPALYTMRYNLTLISDGLLDYSALPYTSPNTTDKIYFEKIGGRNWSYRLRHIYVKHDSTTLKKYFCDNRPNCNLNFVTQVDCQYQRDENSFENAANNEWFKYLNDNVFPRYLEKTIRGYHCDCESEHSNKPRRIRPRKAGGNDIKNSILLKPLDSPPLPLAGNGGPQ